MPQDYPRTENGLLDETRLTPHNRKIPFDELKAITAAMLYLELYPFKFRVPANGHGAVRKLFQTWADRPEPGDFIRNVAAYIALSFCATMALGYYGGRLRWPALSCFLEQPLLLVSSLRSILSLADIHLL